MNQAGVNPAGKYAVEELYDTKTHTGYRLTPVELDTTTSTITDDYILLQILLILILA